MSIENTNCERTLLPHRLDNHTDVAVGKVSTQRQCCLEQRYARFVEKCVLQSKCIPSYCFLPNVLTKMLRVSDTLPM